jgi:hypothetical protein
VAFSKCPNKKLPFSIEKGNSIACTKEKYNSTKLNSYEKNN